MKKKLDEEGVSCGICSISLQQASLAYGISDVVHGILGVAVIISMIIKQENDKMHEMEGDKDKRTGYTKFVEKCPLWVLHIVLGSFALQIFFGILLSLGASNRNYLLCLVWTIGSVLASPLLPMTYCLLGLGRMFQFITVGEFIFKMRRDEHGLLTNDKSTGGNDFRDSHYKTNGENN